MLFAGAFAAVVGTHNCRKPPKSYARGGIARSSRAACGGKLVASFIEAAVLSVCTANSPRREPTDYSSHRR